MALPVFAHANPDEAWLGRAPLEAADERAAVGVATIARTALRARLRMLKNC